MPRPTRFEIIWRDISFAKCPSPWFPASSFKENGDCAILQRPKAIDAGQIVRMAYLREVEWIEFLRAVEHLGVWWEAPSLRAHQGTHTPRFLRVHYYPSLIFSLFSFRFFKFVWGWSHVNGILFIKFECFVFLSVLAIQYFIPFRCFVAFFS